MASTDSSITATFPHVVLSTVATLTSQPTYQSIQIAQRELNANAASVHSVEGGGLHGHLALTITAAAYLALTGVQFDAPVLPPAVPVIPPGATAAQIAESNRQHTSQTKAFHRFHDLDKALLRQLLAAVPALYTDALSDPDYGFTHVTCLAMLTHLKTVYGKLSIAERDLNHQRMTAPWHPPTPIETLFQQLTEGMRLSAAGDEPLVDSQVARMGYNIILRTGVFTDACRDWRLKNLAQQTFAEFKTHFRRMDQDRLETVTSQSAGYHGAANNVQQHPPPATMTLPEALAQLASYQAAANVAMHPAPPPSAPPAPIPPSAPKPKSYCWTHGACRHTSDTCNTKAPGHRDEATFTNKLGGYTYQPRSTNN